MNKKYIVYLEQETSRLTALYEIDKYVDCELVDLAIYIGTLYIDDIDFYENEYNRLWSEIVKKYKLEKYYDR